jgi:hypothetical protein
MGIATLGDVRCTLGASGAFCGSGAGGIEGLRMGVGGSCWMLERSACWPKCGGMEEWQSDSGNGV